MTIKQQALEYGTGNLTLCACYSEPGGTPANFQQFQIIRLLKWPSLILWFFFALRDDVLDVFDTKVLARMKTKEKKQFLIDMYQQCLEDHFAGQDSVMPENLAFLNCKEMVRLLWLSHLSLGKLSLACEGVSSFGILEFQVIDSACTPSKLALISGRDSKSLGLLKFQKRLFS